MGQNFKRNDSGRNRLKDDNHPSQRSDSRCNSVSGSISDSGDGDSESTPRRTTIRPAQTTNYDLSSLRTNDLIELIKLWRRCTCLWNKSVRLGSPRIKRLHAYQLLVLKAKKFDSNIKFLQLKKIIHQLKDIYVKHVNEPKAFVDQDNQEPVYGLNIAQLKTILSELSFLDDSFESNIFEPDEHICTFCKGNFHRSDILWNHMVNTHAPGFHKTSKLTPNEKETWSDSETVTEPKQPAISTICNAATPYSRRIDSEPTKKTMLAKSVTQEESWSKEKIDTKPKLPEKSAKPPKSTIRPRFLVQSATSARQWETPTCSRYSGCKSPKQATTTKNTSEKSVVPTKLVASTVATTSTSAGAYSWHMDTDLPSTSCSKSFNKRFNPGGSPPLRKSSLSPPLGRTSDSESEDYKKHQCSCESEKKRSRSVSYNFESTTDGDTTNTTAGTCTDTSYATDASIGNIGVKRRDRRFMTEYGDKFLEDFIDLYKHQECLWNQNSGLYNNRKMRCDAYNELVTLYRRAHNESFEDVEKVKKLIRRLRARFNELQKPYSDEYRSHIWQRLVFIEDGRSPQARARKQIQLEKQYSGELICNKCNRVFQREQHLKYHMLKVHPFLECAQCCQSFSDADKLKEHILSQHENDEQCPLGCAKCRDWKSSLHLSEHFYNYVCKVCLKIFHDAANFKNHKLKCRIKCQKCGATFSTVLDFRRHSRVDHHEPCPFECETCGATFKYMKAWSAHRREHRRSEKLD